MTKAETLRLADYLGHILEAVARIDEYTADMTEAAFLANDLEKFARIFSSSSSSEKRLRLFT